MTIQRLTPEQRRLNQQKSLKKHRHKKAAANKVVTFAQERDNFTVQDAKDSGVHGAANPIVE